MTTDAVETTDKAKSDHAQGAAPAGLRWMWLKIGLLSFGGPAGQIAMMQTELVDRRGLVEQQTFLRGLNFSMLLPGPEAQQLATWLGWRLGGLWGGVFAGLAFILPGAALMIGLAWAAARYGETAWVQAIFLGVQPVVVAIIAQALFKIGKKSLTGLAQLALAVGSFVAIYFLGAPFPLIVLLAAIAGLLLPHAPAEADADAAPRGSRAYALKIVAAFAGLVAGVYLLTRVLVGAEPFDGVAELFTTAAFVTFGGAYAVLPFVAERAVETYGWLTKAEMLNGLALAESTPGPLILVNVYAGFFAGWDAPGDGAIGALTAALACFYTFAPSFMLILAAAPYVERLQNLAVARRALAGVSAAVVGVIANLAVYLGTAALIPETPSALGAGPLGLDYLRAAIALVAAGLAFGLNVQMQWLVALGALAGLGIWVGGLM
ncbi:MAG: chromate efflux transporter [Pseudomonadota bacterium]